MNAEMLQKLNQILGARFLTMQFLMAIEEQLGIRSAGEPPQPDPLLDPRPTAITPENN